MRKHALRRRHLLASHGKRGSVHEIPEVEPSRTKHGGEFAEKLLGGEVVRNPGSGERIANNHVEGAGVQSLNGCARLAHSDAQRGGAREVEPLPGEPGKFAIEFHHHLSQAGTANRESACEGAGGSSKMQDSRVRPLLEDRFECEQHLLHVLKL